ncbi:hypothetical protein DL768_010585 [Monosporascus sp. mg162]|nr:hypothetical protein DL768_010585 [Monosporascus sp. mg162]
MPSITATVAELPFWPATRAALMEKMRRVRMAYAWNGSECVQETAFIGAAAWPSWPEARSGELGYAAAEGNVLYCWYPVLGGNWDYRPPEGMSEGNSMANGV